MCVCFMWYCFALRTDEETLCLIILIALFTSLFVIALSIGASKSEKRDLHLLEFQIITLK